MLKVKLFFTFCILSVLGTAQITYPTDTLISNQDTIVIFANKTWEYLNKANSKMLFNASIYSHAKDVYHWTDKWDTTTPYHYGNDLSAMVDTTLIPLLDSNHSKFVIPHNGIVTSTYKQRGKRFHYGTDVDVITGDTLRSCFDGVVRYADYSSGGYGNLVVIRHYNGLETYYAHLDKLMVKPNQELNAGDVIGLGGTTGRSTGSHLHFEMRFFGNALNPEKVIDFKNKKLISESLVMHKGLFHYKRNYQYRPPAQQMASNNGDPKYHRIKSGDSLYALALRNKTTVKRICALNGISPNKILRIGEKLRVR
ncbi:MAG: peptidoglycan DD-metalloendopeptidase family protein [Flavobacteriales bacterium]|jgi:ribosomal protein L27|nr:peptidoglycan DD-metalloendopeptidase family protein [Flavobacteriales bacterium]